MTENAMNVSKLVESVDTNDTEMGRDRAGVKITEGWERLVKTTASKVINILIVCNSRAGKWWGGEVNEAIRIRRGSREIHSE